MKLQNAKITILINKECTEIEIFDWTANTLLVAIKLTPEQLSQVLSRLAYVDCECLVGDLTKIGKKHENKSFEFEIEKIYNTLFRDRKLDTEKLSSICKQALLQEGMSEWTPDDYYGSQNSFFKKEGKNYARVTIRRWV